MADDIHLHLSQEEAIVLRQWLTTAWRLQRDSTSMDTFHIVGLLRKLEEALEAE